MNEPNQWIEKLRLLPHPEGGFYREVFRHAQMLSTPQGARNLATSIYFLLPTGIITKWHRVRSDETWYFHAGAPILLEMVDKENGFCERTLGIGMEPEMEPQALVPAGVWQRAKSLGGFSLVSCAVQPGFDFEDFYLTSAESLASEFPQWAQKL